jgi:hypothetical protein
MIPEFRLRILLFFFTIPSALFPQKSGDDASLRALVARFGQAEVKIASPGRDAMDRLTRSVSVISADNKTADIMISPLTLEWFLKSGYDYTIQERKDFKGEFSAASLSEALTWQKYPKWSQYDSIVNYFSVTYPDLCDPDTIGTSINGRYIFALKISDNADTDEDEPKVFYTSTMHGDETGGFVLMLRLAEYLLKNYNSDSRVKELVDNLEIWINPLANPDGTYRSGDIILSPVRFNANGYDLNRNFPDPVTPNTIKQKETIGMMGFMRKHRFVLSANFHAGSEVVNYPWDRWYTKFHADDLWFRQISRAYADTVHVYSGPSYMTDLENGVTRGADWYVVYGGRQDFVTWELQGREVTIELDLTKETVPGQLETLWQNNYHSMLEYLGNALCGIHGRVRDAENGESIPARVYISGHDRDSSHIYSGTLTGSFTRFLSPGSWDLTFSAEGYIDTTINDVIVSQFARTDILVEMRKIITSVDTNLSRLPFLYPNPATRYINAILPESYAGLINVKIFSLSGIKLADCSEWSAQGIPVVMNVSNLHGGTYIVVFTHVSSGKACRSRFIIAPGS